MLHTSNAVIEADFKPKTNKNKNDHIPKFATHEQKMREEAALGRNWSNCLMHDWKALYYASAEDGMKT